MFRKSNITDHNKNESIENGVYVRIKITYSGIAPKMHSSPNQTGILNKKPFET